MGVKMVIHKIYGNGRVISREVNKNGTYITVEFDSGKVVKMVIPDSFEIAGIEASGSLKEEVDKAIALKAQQQQATTPVKVITTPVNSKKNTSQKRWTPSCTLATSYEKYLIENGYRIESDSGNPSTVYSYGNAVDKVVENEGLTWNSLANDINNIVPKYDAGGVYEDIGLKSNKTVINALKRFAEMINQP
jgi:hypothetical protein